MKKIFSTVVFLLSLLMVQAQQKETVNGKRFIVKDSMNLGGVWRSTWPDGTTGIGTAWAVGGNTLGATPGKFGTIDSVNILFYTKNQPILTLEAAASKAVRAHSIIADDDSSTQVATTGWIRKNIISRYYFQAPLYVDGDTVKCSACGSGGSGGGWGLAGNTGTTAGVNFVGTNDAQPLVVKTNNTEVARFSTDSILISSPVSMGLGTSVGGERDGIPITLLSQVVDGSFQIGTIGMDANGTGQNMGAMTFHSKGSGAYLFKAGLGTGITAVDLAGPATLGGGSGLSLKTTSASVGIDIRNDVYQTSNNLLDVKAITQYGNYKHRIITDYTGSTSFGDSATAADPSAAMDIQSRTKGLLIPRLTQTERNAIASPATSLLVYQTDNTPGYYYYNGSSWVAVGTGSSSNVADTLVTLDEGISNFIQQSPAGDTTYQHDYTVDPNIQVLVNGAWVTASRYTNNIAGGSVVRENSFMVFAREQRRLHPNRVVRGIVAAQNNTNSSSWSPYQAPVFGEPDTVNHMMYVVNGLVASMPAGSGKISTVLWQIGENDVVDNNLSSFWFRMKAIDSMYKADTAHFSTNLQMIFAYPKRIYYKLQNVLDSVSNRTLDFGYRNWKIARQAGSSSTDAAHNNGWETQQVGLSFCGAYESTFPTTKKDVYTTQGDTLQTLTGSPASAANVVIGDNSVAFNKGATFNSGSLFTLGLNASQTIRGWTSSTTGNQLMASTFSSTRLALAGLTCTGFSSTTLFSRFTGVEYVSSGGWRIDHSTNNSTLTQTIASDSAGNVNVGTSAPTSKFSVEGSFGAAYVAKTGNYTLTISDYTVDVTANSNTYTLPTAVGCTGRIYTIKNSGSGTPTVATTSSQNIDASTTYSLSAQYKYVTVQSNGANWIIIANN